MSHIELFMVRAKCGVPNVCEALVTDDVDDGVEGSGRKNVLSMRELFCPDSLTGFEKMAGFQIFYCLKI